ncbi:MAG: Type 1 glutamine amidotransferase-like domain-containing protein [Candidatus Saccharimonadia bacterium]
MKLYLSSYRIPNLSVLEILLGRKANETRVALIPNAKDYHPIKLREEKIRKTSDYFRALGFSINIIDLKLYHNPTKLQDELNNYDLIWVLGGNSFVIRCEIEKSGFDIVIRNLLSNGKTYGGESAGAIIAGNSLVGIEAADDPRFADKVILSGMNLTNHFILPHVGNPLYNDSINIAKLTHQDDSSMIELSDSQVYVVDGSSSQVLSAEV